MIPNRTRLVLLTLLATGALLAGTGCGSSSGGGSGDAKKVSLVAYSTPKEAYAKVIAAFQKTPEGKGVTFSQSYGASGEQERAVEAGLKADYVGLSLAPDVDKLVKAQIVPAEWTKTPTKGFVTDSVVVLVTRKGNPKHVRSFADLTKPGIQVVTPNPITSGGARWNILGVYGAAKAEGKSDAAALGDVEKVLKNTVVQDKSGRDALQTFTGGKGDVLISYENEAITAEQKGQDVAYTIPRDTLLIENPAAATTDASAAGKAFAKYVTTPAAQKLFAAAGYRPVIPSLVDKKRFPTPAGLFTIDKLGGWDKLGPEFFDPTTGKVTAIEKKLGVSTAK